MKYGFIIAFLILAAIQWTVPTITIFKKDQVLEKGKSYKFQTEPVDPSNPFKGKYITLNFIETEFTDTIERNLVHKDPVYVILGTDRNGYAVVENIINKEPQENGAYVEAEVLYTSRENDSITVFIQYPFNEYYMDEFKAPQAENIYRESNRDTLSKTYALVKIWKGQAVIEDVMINDIPIRKLLK